MIWLDPNRNKFESEHEIIAKVRGPKIKIYLFTTPEEVIVLLKYLFNLKPILSTSRSSEKFRIVIENYVTNFEAKEYDTRDIEQLADWLKHSGSKIPLCVYTQLQINKANVIHIKKKYTILYLSSDK